MFKEYNIDIVMLFKEAENQRSLLNHEFVGTEHLLLAMLKDKNSLSSKLEKYAVTYERFYNEINKTVNSSSKKIDNNIYTPLLKRVIYNASREDKITLEKLFYYMLDEGEGVAIRILINMNVDVDELYNYFKNSIFHQNSELEIYKIGQVLNDSISLNEMVVGREKEIDLIFQTLLRKKKNNPLLIGDAGVGKSAIIEELTRKIIKGEVPNSLKHTKIVMLEMGMLVSGTKYRGEFEERLTNIINELKENQNIIVFIDEIHTMLGAGAAEGAIAASDILKPYLARGDIKCIGATTKEEYEKTIQKDKALARRFELIMINEPDEEETINIVKKIKNEYIDFHKVKISDEVISILVHLAQVYFPNKRNPDKAIELLDSVMSYVKLKEKTRLIKDKELELKRISLLKIKELEKGNFKNALKKNIEENKIKQSIKKYASGQNIYVNKDDILDVLEYKNKIISNKKHIIEVLKPLNKKYSPKVLKQICSKIIDNNKVTTFLVEGNSSELIKDLSKSLNYDLIKINTEDDIIKMHQKIKYNPSSIISVNNINDYSINETFKKICRDSMFEYQDEIISYHSSIIILNVSQKSMGFNNNIISEIPFDEHISIVDSIPLKV